MRLRLKYSMNWVRKVVSIGNGAETATTSMKNAVRPIRKALQAAVLQNEADYGIALDGRTAFFIDVVAVRLITDTDHLRTQFMEYFRRNRIARTIGGIDHQFSDRASPNDLGKWIYRTRYSGHPHH